MHYFYSFNTLILYLMMKNLIRIFILSAVLLLTGCGSNQPKDLAQDAMTCLQKGDYRGYVDLMADTPDATAEEIEQGKENLANLLQEKAGESIKRKEGIKSFKVLEETVDEEKGKAEVKMEITYGNGDTDTDLLKFQKEEDGKWYLTL